MQREQVLIKFTLACTPIKVKSAYANKFTFFCRQLGFGSVHIKAVEEDAHGMILNWDSFSRKSMSSWKRSSLRFPSSDWMISCR